MGLKAYLKNGECGLFWVTRGGYVWLAGRYVGSGTRILRGHLDTLAKDFTPYPVLRLLLILGPDRFALATKEGEAFL